MNSTHNLVLVAHPSPDLYGSDLQLLVTVRALREAGHDVLAVLPVDGPLRPRLQEQGAQVRVLPFPVLRKSLMTPLGLLRLGVATTLASVRGYRFIRSVRAQTVLVNTITLPCWLAAARLAGTKVVSHVHEAEEDHPRFVRLLLAGQLLLAQAIIVNSDAAARALLDVLPVLRQRTTVVHNGVPGPPHPPTPLRQRRAGDTLRVAMVGRLSPRKGMDVALAAIASLREEGRDVTLTVCGTPFPGYEWYEEQLLLRAQASDLAGAVRFLGYVSPTWPILNDADVVLVPSRVEPFGNAAVEALLAARPVIASAVQGLAEVIRADETGILTTPGDVSDLALALRRISDRPEEAAALAEAGHKDAHVRFTPSRYSAAINAVLMPKYSE